LETENALKCNLFIRQAKKILLDTHCLGGLEIFVQMTTRVPSSSLIDDYGNIFHMVRDASNYIGHTCIAVIACCIATRKKESSPIILQSWKNQCWNEDVSTSCQYFHLMGLQLMMGRFSSWYVSTRFSPRVYYANTLLLPCGRPSLETIMGSHYFSSRETPKKICAQNLTFLQKKQNDDDARSSSNFFRLPLL
jgi:hypothetical protein